MKPHSTKTLPVTLGLIALAGASVPAAEKARNPGPDPTPAPAPASPEEAHFVDSITEAFSKGKISFDTRLRWEYAEQDGRTHSDAVTIRPRLGFTTAPVWGLQAMAEFEGVYPLGNEDNYNQAGLNPGAANKVVVADPEISELNQAWGSFTRWDTTVKGGRQQLVLDNSRWIGDVIWRQNMQTFDAATVRSKALDDFEFLYSYLWQINRVLGDDHPQGRWTANSHVANVAYTGCQYGKAVGYAYLLDFNNSPTIAPTQTYGLSFGGERKICDPWSVNYRAEFAWQSDYGRNNVSYSAPYYDIEAGATYKRFSAGGGYEVLGSDDGKAAVQTPLATAHKFNGWADLFLTTPPDGLRDAFVYAGVKLPGNIPVRVLYHKYWPDSGDREFGQEVDAIASYKFAKYFTALVKYAWYDGQDGPFPDKEVFWMELNFHY